MNARAASLRFAETGIPRPSGSPKELPGPLIPGIRPGPAFGAMLDCDLSFAVTKFPGPLANEIAFAPAVNLSKAGPSSRVTAPGDTQPFLTASTSHCSALWPAELGSVNSGLKLLSKSWPPIASVSRYHGVTAPSVDPMAIETGYCTPAFLSCAIAVANSPNVF